MIQPAPVWRFCARSSMIPRYLSMSSLATFAFRKPCRASGSRWSRINAAALWLCPSIQAKCASSPCLAARKKFIFASSKDIRFRISPYACGSADIKPMKNAALPTSSTIVGPEGNARFSIRRCATPSFTP